MKPTDYQTIFQAAGAALILVEPDGTIILANSEFERLSGYTRDEGKLNWKQFVSPQDLDRLDPSAARCEIDFVDRHGHKRAVTLKCSPLPNSSQTIITILDMGNRKPSEEQLQQAIEDLTAYSYTVAHDLKHPLALITGFSDILLKDLSEQGMHEQAQMAKLILQTSFKMVHIIDELLILASVQHQDIKPHPLDMERIIREVENGLSMMIDEYQARIIKPDRWPAAMGYTTWVEEVWVNYLSNAMKYGGRPPQIDIGATPLDNGMIRFWVKDNGDGIPPEKLPELFTRFKRLNTLRATGHGLGLSIVKGIVEKLGGEVGVESENVPGKGSVFSFTLPARAEE